jgi:hypothetical protein
LNLRPPGAAGCSPENHLVPAGGMELLRSWSDSRTALGRRGRGSQPALPAVKRQGRGSNPFGVSAFDQITGPLRPATSRLTRIRTRTGEVGARHAAVTPRACKRTTRLERASSGRRPGALPTELHPRVKHARLESNQRPLPSQSSALSTELTTGVTRASGRNRTHSSAVRRARACR